MITFGKRNGWTNWLLTAYFSLFAYTSWAAETIIPKAETIAPRSFNNIDQVIGWVKAKGKCEESHEVVRKCWVNVALPQKDDNGKELSPGWIAIGEIVINEFTKDKCHT